MLPTRILLFFTFSHMKNKVTKMLPKSSSTTMRPKMGKKCRKQKRETPAVAECAGYDEIASHRNKYHGEFGGEAVIVKTDAEIKMDDGTKASPHLVRSTLDIMLSAGSISEDMFKAGKGFERDYAIASFEHYSNCDPTRVHTGGDGQGASSELIVQKRRRVMDIVAEMGGEYSVRGSLAVNVLGKGMTLKSWACGGAVNFSRLKLEAQIARGLLIAVLEHLMMIYLPRRAVGNISQNYD